MRKYDLYGGLRDAELSIEKLNALARETASRAVRDGRPRWRLLTAAVRSCPWARTNLRIRFT